MYNIVALKKENETGTYFPEIAQGFWRNQCFCP